MKIVKSYPPNWSEIRAAFKSATQPGVIFCYGDTIYNPSGDELSDALLAHEAVHSHQQGNDPAGWWSRYIKDPPFRFEQELLAHQAEYRSLARDGSRHVRRSVLKQLSVRLAGPLYGQCISRKRAAELLLRGI